MVERSLEQVFPGDGEMARRMREFDWAGSALGDPRAWPQSLVTAVQICLTSRFPIVLWWGPELRLLYNDAWRPVLGKTKHPRALGSPGKEVWPEIWHIIGPMLEGVLAKGEATWSDDQLLPLDRNGYLEEAFFTYSYSPIPGEARQVGGVFAAVNETTAKVLSARRLRTLRELAAQASQAKTSGEAAAMALRTLSANPNDVPFALLYRIGADGGSHLEGHCPDMIAATAAAWPVSEVVDRRQALVLERLAERFGRLPSPWLNAPERALVMPLESASQDRVLAVLVVGVNPGRELDEEHRGFLDIVGRHVATSIANAGAYEEERRRAEALAELDRAKTAFFSNVSHEFRTPLTLMLGPIEDMLRAATENSPSADARTLEVVHRNGERLLKLVNTLLDFARIEAGRVIASYEPTDLGRLTSDLASNFRSACERAGLALEVDCPVGFEPAYIDREMWEKIVLNLLSNAFKFTLEGAIRVRLREAADRFHLVVSDTGTGIPAAELPHMFERFHRVEGARGRSHEGSGIGLALVHELVKLHGGTIGVESEPGRGSSFIVSLPKGARHLPADRIRAERTAASTALRAGAYVAEALSWLPDAEELELAPGRGAARVLLADDNADLRHYVERLLHEQYEVEAVADGQAALAAARAQPPDIVISDIMMPGLDGFALLRALRGDERLRTVPVILLSARAGEEARAEGLGRGADDYLVKPFSARELLVRVEALLRSAAVRREAEAEIRASEERLRAIVETTPECVKVVAADGTLLQMNASGLAMVGAPGAEAVIGKSIYDVIAPEDRERFRAFNEAICRGERGGLEFDIVGLNGARRHMETHAAPLDQADGSIAQLAITRDVTERRRVERELAEAAEFNRSIIESSRDCIKVLDTEARLLYMSENGQRLLCIADIRQFLGKCWIDFWQGEYREAAAAAVRAALAGGSSNFVGFLRCLDGTDRWFDVMVTPILGADGKPARLLSVSRDVSERKRAEERLRRSERELTDFFETAAIGLHWVGPDGTILRANPAELEMLGYGAEEYIGRNIAEFHADAPVIEDILARLTRGEVLREYPARMRCQDGSLRDVLINSSVLFEDGKFLHTRCFTTDVTARRRAEAGLATRARQQHAIARLGERALSERELQPLFDYTTAAIAETLEIEYCNILELSPSRRELVLRAGVGTERSLVGTATIPVDAGTQAAYTLARDAPVIVSDIHRETRFATPMFIDAGVQSGMSCVIRGMEGEPWGVLGAHARRRMDFTDDDIAFLLSASNILSQAIRRHRAEQAVKESDRRKDEFLATLAHELRNPLAPLRNALDILRLSGNRDAGVRQIREIMDRQVHHLVRLVDDLLEMSRISRGALELRREPIEAAAIVRNALETSEPLIRSRGHQIALKLHDGELWFDGDPVRLAQILANLLNNAAKYTDPGGHITVSVESLGDRVGFRVKDDGRGIEPQALPRLFEMFNRGAGPDRAGHDGLGIGLALSRRLAEMHGGSLVGRSDGPGTGAEFVLTVPVAAARQATQPALEARGAPRIAPRRILVVDDNGDAAEGLSMVLKFLGADVHVARDGQEALQAVQAYDPAVVFLDIGMPGMDGYEVARRIRARRGARQPAIVALTGWGQAEDRRRAREAGFDHHIVKPAEMDALQTLLERLDGQANTLH
ncbi:MAG: ATP-binding protein [Burkholderiales bacterium]